MWGVFGLNEFLYYNLFRVFDKGKALTAHR